jgi:hypothetical protein
MMSNTAVFPHNNALLFLLNAVPHAGSFLGSADLLVDTA